MLSMKEIWIVYLCLALCRCVHGSGGTVTPSNTAVYSGRRTAMECRVSNGSRVFHWTFAPGAAAEYAEKILNIDKGTQSVDKTRFPRVSIEMEADGSGFLYVSHTRPEDAGVYTCIALENSEESRYSAALIVFESEPFCETNHTADSNSSLSEGDLIWMQCRVNFVGLWDPTVEWRQHETNAGPEDQGREVTNAITMKTATKVNSSITSTLIVKVTSDASTYYSFRLFFAWDEGKGYVTATNVPKFNFTWRSPDIFFVATTFMPTLNTDALTFSSEGIVARPALQRRETDPSPNGSEKSSTTWYVVSGALVAIIFAFVSVCVIQNLTRRRRRRRSAVILAGISSVSRTTPVCTSERPISGSYDSINMANNNVYDRIEETAISDGAAACDQTQQGPPMLESYSCLSIVAKDATDVYDTLDSREKSDRGNDIEAGKVKESKETDYLVMSGGRHDHGCITDM